MYSSPSKIKQQNVGYQNHTRFPCKEDNENTRCNSETDYVLAIKTKISQINFTLAQFCQEKIEEQNSKSVQAKLNNLKVIQFLLEEIVKLQRNTQRMTYDRRKTDKFILQQEQMVQRISKEQRSVSHEKDLMLQRKDNLQRSFKQTKNKMVVQKEQLLKQIRMIQAREKAYEAQFRKKDRQITALQDKIRKIHQKGQSKVCFEVFEASLQGRKVGNCKQGETEYTKLIMDSYSETVQNLEKQNKLLKQYLITYQSQLNSVFELANEKLVIFNDLLGETEPLKILRTEILKSFVARQTSFLEQVCQNINKVKLLIEKVGLSENVEINLASQPQNFKSKQILENYKLIVKSQDQLLNKMILKSEEFMVDQNQIEERCSESLQRYDFDKVQNIIKEQMKYVQAKNKELVSTKQKLSKRLERTQCIKRQILEQVESLL